MRMTIRKWLILATSLLFVGCILFTGVMFMLKWDFRKLSTTRFETNTHIVTEEFSEIAIITNTANIEFQPSENKQCKIVCFEEEKSKHSVSVENKKLSIQILDQQKWYDHIGINFNTPKITVYLPEVSYGDLIINSSTGDLEIDKGFSFSNISVTKSTGDVVCCASASGTINIKTTTGDITVDDITSDNVDLSVTTGNIKAQSVICNNTLNIKVNTGKSKIFDSKCGRFASTGSTGDISTDNLIVSQDISIERSTGDIILKGTDASELYLKTSTGDIKGTLLTDKIFIVKTDTGDINVPQTRSGGKCEAQTDTGDIIIDIK